MAKLDTPLLSIVVPCFNEAAAIPKLAGALEPVLASTCSDDYEVVLIDDGSRDNTADAIDQWCSSNARVCGLFLSRNFGKEAALSCGLHFARGRAVVILDADLQDPPDLIPAMLARWRDGADVVLAKRVARKRDGWIKRITARAFYRVMAWLAESMVPPQVGDFRLLDRRVVDALAQLPERTRFMKGLMNYAGFKIDALEYERPGRSTGQSQWSLWRLWNLALDGITSFTTVPLRAWSYLGVLV
ncbi:MAG: glycosyltransferase family 2 protein, partial [Pseudomonadota bacterium]